MHLVKKLEATHKNKKSKWRTWTTRAGTFALALAFTAVTVLKPWQAQAETRYASDAIAQFVSGTLLGGLNLQGVAGIDGAYSTFIDGLTTGDQTQKATLDLTALSLLNVDLGSGLSIPLGSLLELGVLNQYAEAEAHGIAHAATGAVSDDGAIDISGTGEFPSDAKINLLTLLNLLPGDIADGILTEAGITLEAITAIAAADASNSDPIATSCANPSAPDHCVDYNIADASIDLASPLLGDIFLAIYTSSGSVDTALDALSGSITDGILSQSLGLIEQIGALVPGISLLSNDLKADINVNLQSALAPILSNPITVEGVTVDLGNGTISVDLAAILGGTLEGLAPNTSLLSATNLQELTSRIADALAAIQEQLNTILAAALDAAILNISGGICLVETTNIFTGAVSCTAGIEVGFNGTLGELVRNQKNLTLVGNGVVSVANTLLNTATGTVQGALGDIVEPAITNILEGVGETVGAVVTDVANSLNPVLLLLDNIVNVTINSQVFNNDIGTARETAVRVDILDFLQTGRTALSLDLATAMIGATVVPYMVNLDATNTEANTNTTITGTHWPANTQVVLRMQDTSGNPFSPDVSRTVTTDSNGDFTTTLLVPDGTSVGEYQIYADDTADGGNETSTTSFYVIDATAPVAPEIENPINGSSTNMQNIIVFGTGIAGNTVTVKEGDTVICENVTVAAGGSWTCATAHNFAEGSHTISATQTDPSANTSIPATSTFTVDMTAPSDPVVSLPADNTSTNDSTPTIVGTADANTDLEIFIDGSPVGTTQSDGSGDWSLQVAETLADGSHEVYAVATDPAGNTANSNTNTFTVDTANPMAPIIVAPTDGDLSGSASLVIHGTGESGDTIVVREGSTVLCTVVVQPNNTWTCPVRTFTNGTHTITAIQTDAAGNASPADTASFTVDTLAPAMPVISYPGNNETISNALPTIEGTAEPNANVVVSVDGTALGMVAADASGNWSISVSTELIDGAHTVEARAVDLAGNSSGTTTNNFIVDTTPAPVPVISYPTDGLSVNNASVVIAGTGTAGDTIKVMIPGGAVICTTTVQASGTWACEAISFTEESHTIYATQTDAGGESDPSASVTFTVDLTAPDMPEIDAPAEGSIISDTTPTISGTAEIGSTVSVDLNGWTDTVVATDGTWSIDYAGTPLPEGQYTVIANATDAAGNTSSSTDNNFSVDTSKAPAPEITEPTNGLTSGVNAHFVSGTGISDNAINVYDGATLICTATVNIFGGWTCGEALTFSDGTHTLTATQTDAGGVSDPSTPVVITIDTVAPMDPVIISPANGSTTNDNTPTISGTAGEAYIGLEIFIDGASIGTTASDASGNWTVPTETALSDGPHYVEVVSTDSVGHSSAKVRNNFVVDTFAPLVEIARPAHLSTTSNPTPLIRGTTEANTSVEVFVDGASIGTVESDLSGAWSLQTPTALSDGPHTVSAIATDAIGNSSAMVTNNFTIDTSLPAEPEVTSPVDGSATNSPAITVAGTGDVAGNKVTVKEGDTLICEATIGIDLTWTCSEPYTFTEGDHALTVFETDSADNKSPDVTVDFTIDTEAPTVLVTTPTEGSRVWDKTPTLAGTSEVGATVEVFLDGTSLGTVPVTSIQPMSMASPFASPSLFATAVTGNWTIETPSNLAYGQHTVSAVATDRAGNTSSTDSNIFRLVPRTPSITSPTNGEEVRNDQTPTITGTGEAGDTVTVKDSDGTVLCTATVATDGTWTCTSSELPLGDHTITATQTSPSGEESDPSDPIAVQLVLFKEEADPVFYDPNAENGGSDGNGMNAPGTGHNNGQADILAQVSTIGVFGAGAIAAAFGTIHLARRSRARR